MLRPDPSRLPPGAFVRLASFPEAIVGRRRVPAAVARCRGARRWPPSGRRPRRPPPPKADDGGPDPAQRQRPDRVLDGDRGPPRQQRPGRDRRAAAGRRKPGPDPVQPRRGPADPIGQDRDPLRAATGVWQRARDRARLGRGGGCIHEGEVLDPRHDPAGRRGRCRATRAASSASLRPACPTRTRSRHSS